MSKLGLQFVSGQILKNAELNLMVDAINDNADVSASAKKTAEDSYKIANALNQRDIDISQEVFDNIPESELDPTKTYYIYV